MRMQLRHWLAGHTEPLAFWILVVLYLLPVWTFRYLPTQDGPAHVNNAQIIKDYGNTAAGYQAFFELRWQALPNLTSHFILAALLYVFPPLIAEKLLVSLYFAGFAASFRYFLGSFGPRCRGLSAAGLVLVYNRCLWLGFYNYCLGLALFWIVLGYVVRRRQTLHVPGAVMLMWLFMAAFFTHLVAFLLAYAGALAATVLVPPRRLLAPILILLAGLPALCLAMDYFDQTGFFKAASAMKVVHQPLARLRGERMERSLGQELAALDDELIAHHAGSAIPTALLGVAYLGLLAGFRIAEGRAQDTPLDDGPGCLFPAVFGLLALGACLLLPNNLGVAHGGFLKTRLAPLPFLLWLACFREPASGAGQFLVRSVTVLLLAVNLLLVFRTVQDGNRQLDQYTAGIEAMGTGRRMFVVQREAWPAPLVDPLLHAADYYCLGTGNVSLDNYEAGTPHFPVKYRRGVGRGRNNWVGYSHQNAVDVVLCWQTGPRADCRGPDGWDEVFGQGRLHIYRRPPGLPGGAERGQ